eukprot:847053-Pelagomonas_calceolata.AAC.1
MKDILQRYTWGRKSKGARYVPRLEDLLVTLIIMSVFHVPPVASEQEQSIDRTRWNLACQPPAQAFT